MKPNTRSLHRDIGYLYIGLIISFSLSGIFQNHRQTWHPEKYKIETRVFHILPIENTKEINDEFSKKLGEQYGVKDKFRRSSVKDDRLKISYENNDVEINLKSGQGEIVTYNKTPFVSHIMKLHKDTSPYWIYYSDIFALSLITLAITGALMISNGPMNYKHRGWKLTAIGLIFPLIFLFLLS